jgi:MSHA pilin protein MshC
MTELVMVIVIGGILAVVAIPKLAGRLTFESRGFADEVRGAIQYAQKTAIASRRTVCVDITSSTVTLTRAASASSVAACPVDTPVVDPATGTAFTLTAPSGVTLSTAHFAFDALGQTAAAVTITVAGDVSRTIAVEQLTGYVH